MGSKHFRTVYDIAKADADAVIRCLGCRRVSRIGAMALVNRMGAMVKIADAERRLRCTVCGHRGAQLGAIPRL